MATSRVLLGTLFLVPGTFVWFGTLLAGAVISAFSGSATSAWFSIACMAACTVALVLAFQSCGTGPRAHSFFKACVATCVGLIALGWVTDTYLLPDVSSWRGEELVRPVTMYLPTAVVALFALGAALVLPRQPQP